MKSEFLTSMVLGLKHANIDFVASLPTRTLAPIIEKIAQDSGFIHVPLTNEEDGIGICSGAYLAGRKPALMVQSTGMVKASWSLLETLHEFGGFPFLLIVDYRGGFGEIYPQYFGVGTQLPAILESYHVPYSIVNECDKLENTIVQGQKSVEASGKPAAILFCGEEMQIKLNW